MALECKSAQKGIPNSMWETYSAFANTYGGTILLGVVEHLDEHDKSKRFEITGVNDTEKMRKDLWNTINNKEKVNINLLRDEDVRITDIEGKSIIAVSYSPRRILTSPCLHQQQLNKRNIQTKS